MLRDESVQTLIALASLTIIVLFLLTFYPTNVTAVLIHVSFLSKSRHTVYGLPEKNYHGIIGNATTDINGSNVTDIRSNNTTARSAMNMNSSSMSLSNTSWVQYVSPNVNVLYGNAWLDMTKGPLVLKVPPIPDRYYVFQFMDAFANVFTYVGARTTGSTGGNYLLTLQNWSGQVPSGMTEIKIPTNLAYTMNKRYASERYLTSKTEQ
jgi:hypothetical protein